MTSENVTPEIERLELGELAEREALREASFQEGTFVQRAGLRLTYLVLGLTALLTLAFFGHWALTGPSVTDFGRPVTAESMAQYQKASDLAFQRLTGLLDAVISRTLLPVLTLLLGYVFGARETTQSPPSAGGGR